MIYALIYKGVFCEEISQIDENDDLVDTVPARTAKPFFDSHLSSCKGGAIHETDVQTECKQAQEGARVSRKNEHEKRP